jgi:hypothetical protein
MRRYRHTTEHGRRRLNQAIFEELLIDPRPDEPIIIVAG